ncbi:MAG: hypothetical protein OEZ10_07900 [Gammaproteobacteria bacterium]|nr:hypothetical protein [Gammaproteobacteria bacterium]
MAAIVVINASIIIARAYLFISIGIGAFVGAIWFSGTNSTMSTLSSFIASMCSIIVAVMPPKALLKKQVYIFYEVAAICGLLLSNYMFYSKNASLSEIYTPVEILVNIAFLVVITLRFRLESNNNQASVSK